MNWINLGKRNRSKLAKFLDENEVSQQELSKKSGVSKSTISRLCQIDNVSPTMKNARKIVKALRDLTKKNVDYDDFFNI